MARKQNPAASELEQLIERRQELRASLAAVEADEEAAVLAARVRELTERADAELVSIADLVELSTARDAVTAHGAHVAQALRSHRERITPLDGQIRTLAQRQYIDETKELHAQALLRATALLESLDELEAKRHAVSQRCETTVVAVGPMRSVPIG